MREGLSTAIGAGVAALAMLLASCGGTETGPEPGASPAALDTAAPAAAASAEPDLASVDLGFGGTDKDRDGRISSAEYAANSTVLFGSMDGDDDGGLTVAELDAARSAMRIVGGPSSEKLIARSDNDGDEKLTLAEFIADVNRRFGEADTDSDGFLNPTEFHAGHPEVGPARPAAPDTPAARK